MSRAPSLAVWLTVADGLPGARDVALLGDGKEPLTATLENKRGQQRFDLREPATFKELTFRVLSTYPGNGQPWGSVIEIEGFDEAGENVLLSVPRMVPRMSPEEVIAVYRQIKQVDKVRPVLLGFTFSFTELQSPYAPAMRERLYPEFVKGCDVAGFDVYPIFGHNYPSRLDWVAEGTSELVAIAGPGRPVWATIETNKGSQWVSADRQLDVEPKHTRCEVWMAIIRGATAISYFTHRWQPDYKQFAPEGEMVVELKRLNDQITRLAPAILADPARVEIGMSLTGGLPCHLKATELDGDLCIFAQNIDIDPNKDELRQGEQISPRSGKATITVAGLTAGTRIEVIDEGRTITADFGPLAEHIYKLKL